MSPVEFAPKSLASGVYRHVLRCFIFCSALFAGSNTSAEVPASEVSESALSALSGARGKTMFATLSPADTGIVTENNYADPRETKTGYKDPRMAEGHYDEFAVGAVGTGVAI